MKTKKSVEAPEKPENEKTLRKLPLPESRKGPHAWIAGGAATCGIWTANIPSRTGIMSERTCDFR